jgi:hypothetical protein
MTNYGKVLEIFQSYAKVIQFFQNFAEFYPSYAKTM